MDSNISEDTLEGERVIRRELLETLSGRVLRKHDKSKLRQTDIVDDAI